MTLNDDATLIPGAGNYFTAPTGTALPADLLAPGVAWTNLGHTSLEDLLSISSEGGEATVIGTLQNKALRTKRTARTETFKFTVQQFDEDALKLYFGANSDVDVDDGSLGVPLDPTPTIGAFMVVFVDGDNHFAFYAPKSEILRADDLSLGDSESLAGMPIGVTPVAISGNPFAYRVTPLGGE